MNVQYQSKPESTWKINSFVQFFWRKKNDKNKNRLSVSETIGKKYNFWYVQNSNMVLPAAIVDSNPNQSQPIYASTI